MARGVALVNATGGAFNRVSMRIAYIDGGIADIAMQAVDQSNTLKQVNLALAEIDQSTQQNASMAEEATDACRSLTEQCTQLADMVGRFRVSAERPKAASLLSAA